MHICFIQTGGTIDKDYPAGTGAYAFKIGKPATEELLNKVEPSFEYTIVELCKKDSQDLTDNDRQQMIESIKQTETDKIIITHGTDTMIKTGLSLNKIKNKTVILTGALRPASMSKTDADFNIGVAIGAIPYLSHGIYVCMNGIVKDVNLSQRDLNTGRFY